MRLKMKIKKMIMFLKFENLLLSQSRKSRNQLKNQYQSKREKTEKKVSQMDKISDFLLKLQNKWENQL